MRPCASLHPPQRLLTPTSSAFSRVPSPPPMCVCTWTQHAPVGASIYSANSRRWCNGFTRRSFLNYFPLPPHPNPHNTCPFPALCPCMLERTVHTQQRHTGVLACFTISPNFPFQGDGYTSLTTSDMFRPHSPCTCLNASVMKGCALPIRKGSLSHTHNTHNTRR